MDRYGQFPDKVESPEHWVEIFREAFAGGSFASVARLSDLCHPDYRGVQPQTPDAVGPAGFLDLFSRLYALIPDLSGVILDSHVHDDGVIIEVRVTGTLGGRPVVWDACDKFRFQDGLVAGRVTYLDPTPLLAAIATRPRAWHRWWRSGLGSPRRPVAAQLQPSADLVREPT